MIVKENITRCGIKIEGSGRFSRHARASGHPAFSAKHFWIPACAEMTSFELKNFPTPQFN
jgi:hypothetical protein